MHTPPLWPYVPAPISVLMYRAQSAFCKQQNSLMPKFLCNHLYQKASRFPFSPLFIVPFLRHSYEFVMKDTAERFHATLPFCQFLVNCRGAMMDGRMTHKKRKGAGPSLTISPTQSGSLDGSGALTHEASCVSPADACH